MGIGETLHRALAKLAIREAGDQSKTVCGNLQLCAGLKADIEGATHAVGQRRLERLRERSREEEARLPDEEESEIVEAGVERLSIETAVTEEEAT